jgi:hypothetical protein
LHNQNPAAQRKGSGKNFRNLVFQFPHGIDCPHPDGADQRAAEVDFRDLAHGFGPLREPIGEKYGRTLAWDSSPYKKPLSVLDVTRWLVGFGLNACILSDAANQPPLILKIQGSLPYISVYCRHKQKSID